MASSPSIIKPGRREHDGDVVRVSSYTAPIHSPATRATPAPAIALQQACRGKRRPAPQVCVRLPQRLAATCDRRAWGSTSRAFVEGLEPQDHRAAGAEQLSAARGRARRLLDVRRASPSLNAAAPRSVARSHLQRWHSPRARPAATVPWALLRLIAWRNAAARIQRLRVEPMQHRSRPRSRCVAARLRRRALRDDRLERGGDLRGDRRSETETLVEDLSGTRVPAGNRFGGRAVRGTRDPSPPWRRARSPHAAVSVIAPTFETRARWQLTDPHTLAVLEQRSSPASAHRRSVDTPRAFPGRPGGDRAADRVRGRALPRSSITPATNAQPLRAAARPHERRFV